MDVPDVSYLTAAEVKQYSLVTGLKDGSTGVLEDEDIETLITTAEDQIDAYCGQQPHHPNDSTRRVFPREQDFSKVRSGGTLNEYPDIAVIPYNVSRACLRQVEWLYLQWWPNSATSQPTSMNYVVEQQAISGDGGYSETRAMGGTDLASASLCDQAKLLLKGYVSRWAAIGTTDVRTSAYPRTDGL